jgi:hypothetical protein
VRATHRHGPGSLVDEVGRQVRAASAELPVPELHAASLRLGEASQHLVRALRGGASSPAVPTLRAAGEHLDLATGLLLRAQDALAEYLQMIGLPPGDRRAGPAPGRSRRDPAAQPPEEGRLRRGSTRAGGALAPPAERKEREERTQPEELDETDGLDALDEDGIGAWAFWGGDDSFDDSVDTDYWPDDGAGEWAAADSEPQAGTG